jgi:hypothetical protein
VAKERQGARRGRIEAVLTEEDVGGNGHCALSEDGAHEPGDWSGVHEADAGEVEVREPGP